MGTHLKFTDTMVFTLK